MYRCTVSERLHKITLLWLQVITLALVSYSSFVNADTIRGKVVGVSDGDTITVLDVARVQHKIRLMGIDAPEKAQAFGQRSKEHLSNLVFAKQVTVKSDKVDKYGRTVGKVIVDGKDANLEQIRAGLAWHYKEYQKEQSQVDRVAYASAEAMAKGQKFGLWVDQKPMPPWEWRHGGKDQPTAQNESSGCLCGGASFCTGPRGGQYCVAPNGKKKY